MLRAGSDSNHILSDIHESIVYGARIGIFPGLHSIISTISQTLSLPTPFDSVSKWIQSKIDANRAAKASGGSREMRSDFITQLLARYEEGKLDEIDVFNSMGANIAAGSDTIAISLSSFFYYVMQSENMVRELRNEIDEATLGKDISEPITYSEARQMPFLQACIKEALRLHPATGYPLLREIPKGGAQVAGRFFPEGVGPSFYLLSKHFLRYMNISC